MKEKDSQTQKIDSYKIKLKESKSIISNFQVIQEQLLNKNKHESDKI